MATKKKQITETTKPVELPKEKPVAAERVKAVLGTRTLKPTYASTQYLSDSFECTRCYQLATRRFGKTPVWQDPAELWEAYAIYTAWCEATPVIVYEAIKSGPAAGTLYEVPKKHLQSESEFTAFLGPCPPRSRSVCGLSSLQTPHTPLNRTLRSSSYKCSGVRGDTSPLHQGMP